MDSVSKDLEPAERDYYTVYVLRGITYVPHYRERGTYVGPGSVRHSVFDLQRAGAQEGRAYLWGRAW